MAQSVLGRTPAHMGMPNRICRKASRLTARSYKLACRRAWRELVSARFSRGMSVILPALSAATAPFRAAGAAAVYFFAGCASRFRHLANGKSFSLLTAPKEAVRRKSGHIRMNMALAFAAAGVLIFAASIYRVGLEVILDGESIGYVSSQGIVEESLAVVSEKASEILGRPFTITPDITYRFSIVNKNKLFDSEGVETSLLTGISDIDRLCVLVVDGRQIAAMWFPNEIQTILDELLDQYPADGKKTFFQDVSVQSQLASLSLLRTQDELRAMLTSTSNSELRITVMEGDTIESIANAYRIPASELLLLNPELETPLESGRELLLRREAPMLSVLYSEQVQFFETVPFDTEYVDDPTLWLGEEKTVVYGVDGEAMIMAMSTSIDGYHPETDEIGRLIVVEPVTETIAVGSRTRETTGTFIRPSNGKISSRFGMRRHPVFGDRRMHRGVDFSAPRGDPILAADGGVVEFAGRQSGFGLVVIIDHRNGYRTVYAHCSRIHVEAGQRVGQGEHIANVGSTGTSTGNHLHFEIRVNGVAKNPLPYLGLR
jgi:murein DD-endopeptidase MepM/ murein hydrolase activator NlpD